MLNIEKQHTGGGCWSHWLTFDSGRVAGISNVDYFVCIPPKGEAVYSPAWDENWDNEAADKFLVYNWREQNFNDIFIEAGYSEEEIMILTNYCFKSETADFRWEW